MYRIWHFKLGVASRRRSFVEFKAGRLVAVLQRHVDAALLSACPQDAAWRQIFVTMLLIGWGWDV